MLHMEEILELSSLPLQLSLTLGATSPALCLHMQRSCHYVEGAAHLYLLGPPPPKHTHTNSRSLALIEPLFLFQGILSSKKCLASLSRHDPQRQIAR